MSLVLNTNDQGNGSFQVTNQNIFPTYPDFGNSILMFPSNLKKNGSSEAFNVNGTSVLDICGSISSENYYRETTSNVQNAGVGVYMGGGTAGSTYQRIFAFENTIDAGFTIGKNIIYPRLIVGDYGGSYPPMVKIEVGILHSDGTISIIGNGSTYYTEGMLTSAYIVNPNNGGHNTRKRDPNTKTETTNGILTQNGDRVMFRASMTLSSTGPASNAILFGSFWTTTYIARIEPIQVSIE